MGNDHVVLVGVELIRDKKINPLSLEGLAAGRKLAEILKAKLKAVVFGKGIAAEVEELRAYPLDGVYQADLAQFEFYRPEVFLDAWRQAVEQIKPQAVLFGQTVIALDLAPRLAFLLSAGLITDCVGLESEGGQLLFIKPVYSSNVMAAYGLAGEPYLATMRAGSYDPLEKGGAAAEVVPLKITPLDASQIKIEVRERLEEPDQGIKITQADIIVSGGRGIGGPEGFKDLAEVATLLKGAVGASRPPCDLGWAPPQAQVGQTGEIVRPSVYIAVGISGATQHLAGMSGSKTIVAINKDKEANIFKVADYGVVGTYQEIIPAFKEALKELGK